MPPGAIAPEQIMATLREFENLEAQGSPVAARCKRLGISEQTFFRTRSRRSQLWNDPGRFRTISGTPAQSQVLRHREA